MRLESPWALLILLLIPVMAWWNLYRRPGAAFRFSSLKHVFAAGTSLRVRLIHLPLVLRCLALALLALALARPQQGMERVRDFSRGIAIEMVVDRSGSMGAGMEYEGKELNRLDVVKRVFREFVYGNGEDLEGRPNDLIGMISFARYADTACPLTLGHGALRHFLDNIHLVQRREEDGTAIGDAIALAAARLKTAEQTLRQQHESGQEDYEIKSKIIILLTDGQNNTGKRNPVEAASIVKEWGITIYTIGIGGGRSGVSIQGLLGPMMLPGGMELDERTLKGLAQMTGGRYFRANNAEALREVYEVIGKLETSEIESERYMDYREWFTPFALAALALLALEVMLANTVFRRLP
jgi:Ca-activated chloride channel homolog